MPNFDCWHERPAGERFTEWIDRMTAKYQTLLHEWFDQVWNKRNADAIDRLLAATTVIHGIEGPNGKPVRGRKAFKKFHQQFLGAFPDLTVRVVDTVSEGDKIAARCIVRGRHQGDTLGFLATGKKTEFTGVCIVRVKNGKFVEGWNNFDFLTMHGQLGSLKFFVK